MNTYEELNEVLKAIPLCDRAIVLSGISGGKATCMEDLTEEEARKLLEIYRGKMPCFYDPTAKMVEMMIKKEWRSKVLVLAEKTGLKERGDFRKFNRWMEEKSRFKKHLNAHSIAELELLYKQLRGVERSHAKSAKNPLTQAWFKKGKALINYN